MSLSPLRFFPIPLRLRFPILAFQPVELAAKDFEGLDEGGVELRLFVAEGQEPEGALDPVPLDQPECPEEVGGRREPRRAVVELFLRGPTPDVAEPAA